MWVTTNKQELVNIDNFDVIAVEGKTVVAKSGASKTVMYDVETADKAKALYAIVAERLQTNTRHVDAIGVYNAKVADQKRAAEIAEQAKIRDEETRKRSEGKLNKPITDKRE